MLTSSLFYLLPFLTYITLLSEPDLFQFTPPQHNLLSVEHHTDILVKDLNVRNVIWDPKELPQATNGLLFYIR